VKWRWIRWPAFNADGVALATYLYIILKWR
jgi:hypothetical protein